MGGDFAPANAIRGAAEAVRAAAGRFTVVLTGPEETLRSTMKRELGSEFPAEIVHAPGVITMEDGPTAALKQKRDSSIAVGLRLQQEGRAEGFVSAGNTGAVMSASTMILGRIEGVSRPVIGAFFPSETGRCLILDAGANVDSPARHLVEFAIMGSIYTEEMFGVLRPTVGLLNVGEEESKGGEIAREAHALLKSARVNFVGNVEGRDILKGKVNIVVCDGFTGNILLKFGESVPSFFKHTIREAVKDRPFHKLLLGLASGALRSAFKSLDYEEHGGVPLLGVRGVSIIGHGKSTPKAIMNMILRAEEMVRKNINARIERALSPLAPVSPVPTEAQ
jgi:glycerol-3-phosphate acyltransferase PlsX